MDYKIIASPTAEPLSLSEAKLHCRVDHDDEDELISTLIIAAREYCEAITGRALAPQTIEAYPKRFPALPYIELPRPPLLSVASVVYKSSDGTETTMTDYIVDAGSTVGKIALPYGATWPSFTAYPVNPIKITYTAGYETVPRTVKQAMLLLIGHWYRNREEVGQASSKLEMAVDALLSIERVRWF